jgi:hypothetical protein
MLIAKMLRRGLVSSSHLQKIYYYGSNSTLIIDFDHARTVLGDFNSLTSMLSTTSWPCPLLFEKTFIAEGVLQMILWVF